MKKVFEISFTLQVEFEEDDTTYHPMQWLPTVIKEAMNSNEEILSFDIKEIPEN